MTPPDRQIWSGMLSHLRAMHAPVCRQWFEELEPLGISGGILSIRASTAVHRDYLRRQCLEPFNDAARTVSERLLTIEFLGPEDEPIGYARDNPGAGQRSTPGAMSPGRPAMRDSPSNHGERPDSTDPEHSEPLLDSETEPKPRPDRKALPARTSGLISDLRRDDSSGLSLVLNPDYAFEHFVVGPTNRLAHAAALAVAANPGRAYNPYFVHGDVGLGKTHLLQAICLRIKEALPGARIYYTSCEGFMTQFMDAVQAGEMTHFRHTFRDVDVLVIDDVHFLAKRDRTQEEFFHTFNSLYQLHRQIILSSDAPPHEIPDLEDRLVSRFKWGLVASVAPPCYETRVAILKNKARLRGLEMPDDVACHIAARVETNIRELEGVVVKLQVLSGVEKRGLDLDLAKAALGEEPERSDRQIQIQVIINAVTEFFGIKMTDLQSKKRHRSITLPRQVCMYLARKFTRHSLEEIGGYFGGRDHTTVMHAVTSVKEKMEQEAGFDQIIHSLEEVVRAPAA
jgi:chromosomal replication initiator protein